MSNRAADWNAFAEFVEAHIEDYTVPQYKDFPDDYLTKCSPVWCVQQIERYTRRFGSNARGPGEAIRDLMKIAHYAQVAWSKLRDMEGEGR